MVSTYMMNLFKLARDNGIFCQYEDFEVTRDAERRKRTRYIAIEVPKLVSDYRLHIPCKDPD